MGKPNRYKKPKIAKEITADNELRLYYNTELIYQRWLNSGEFKVHHQKAYDHYCTAKYSELEFESFRESIIVKASLRLLSTEEGGRRTGIWSGYRPNHVFEYHETGMVEAFMGEIKFEEPECLHPGHECNVRVRFLWTPRLEQFMEPGRLWYIHEASRKVGTAKIMAFESPEPWSNA